MYRSWVHQTGMITIRRFSRARPSRVRRTPTSTDRVSTSASGLRFNTTPSRARSRMRSRTRPPPRIGHPEPRHRRVIRCQRDDRYRVASSSPSNSNTSGSIATTSAPADSSPRAPPIPCPTPARSTASKATRSPRIPAGSSRFGVSSLPPDRGRLLPVRRRTR